MNDTVRKPERVIAYIRDHKWAILPESLETIWDIANRANTDVDVEALAAKMGKRLDKSSDLSVRGDTAVLAVDGPLFRYANLFTQMSGATSYETLARDFNMALENPQVKNIVLDINSPGGQVDGVNELANMIRAGRDKKNIVAYVSHTGASAAYLIASAASKIVLDDMASVGSIGTVATVRAMKDKDTVEIVSTQSPKKRPDVTTDEGRAQLQEHVDALADVFIEAVAANRGVPKQTVLDNYGQGGVYVGKRAIAAGMAEELGSLESVIASLNQTSKRQETVDMNLKDATRAALQQENPALCNELIAVGRAEELARIQAVMAQSLPGHEALIQKLAFDGKTTGEQAAMAVLAAERTAREQLGANVRRDAPPPAPADRQIDPPAPAAKKPAAIDSNMSDEDLKTALKAEWDADEGLRAEFEGNFDSYVAYRKQEARGNVAYFKQSQAK